MIVINGKLLPLAFILSFLVLTSPLRGSSFTERPAWLLNSKDTPSGWTYSSETEVDDHYYVYLLSPDENVFSLETLVLPNASAAINYVEAEYGSWQSNGFLDYIFPNKKVNLSVTDLGYVWEIKGPCCYSRGVVYSIENIYIFVFGSQSSTWEEINLINTYQIIKVFDYLNKEVPASLYENLSLYEELAQQNSTFGWTLPLVFLSLLMGVLLIKRKQ